MDENFAEAFKKQLLNDIKNMTEESPEQTALFLSHMAEMTERINYTLKKKA